MSIWSREISAKILNERCKNSLSDHLGICFTFVGEDFVEATMEVNQKTMQPMNVLHGGASCALAETLGSAAANYCIDEGKVCVGLSLHINHLKAAKKGLLKATAKPNHLGRRTQVWQITIIDEEGRTISITSLTLAVIEKKSL